MRRYRKRTLLLFVAGALVGPALVLTLLSVKLVRDLSDIGRTVRGEYGAYLAGIAADVLEAAFLDDELVNMVAARFVPPEGPDEVVRFLNRFQRENPLYLMSFFVVPEGLVFYSGRDYTTPGDRTAPYRPIPPSILEPILAGMLRKGNVPSGLQHLVYPGPEGPVQTTYFTLSGNDGGLLGVAGFVWDLDYVRESAPLERILRRGIDENENLFRGAFFRAPLGITLLDEDGRPIYRTADASSEPYIARRHLNRLLPFYSVAIQIEDDRFDAWIQTLVRTNSILIAGMFLVIVIALGFSLRFVIREIELAEMKTSLVSNVSHELKTPLSLIRLFAETLELGRAGSRDKEQEFLRIISKESERLTHLINNVLDINRIEQGRKTYAFAPVDLGRVLGDVLEAYAYSLDKQGFRAEVRLDEDVPPVSADADAVTQAVINLMENAIKYSGESRYLGITLERNGEFAVISVQDKGVGIPPGDRERIFEKFYRVERGLVHDIKGSGLGLALVQHIAEAHGGRITVTSRLGEGSTFSLHLPLHRPEPAPEAALDQGL
jgi:signal transduction histidine kinase